VEVNLGMDKNKQGKILVIVGIIIAIVPMILISALAYASGGPSLGALGSYGPFAFFIIGIIIAVVGEYIRRK